MGMIRKTLLLRLTWWRIGSCAQWDSNLGVCIGHWSRLETKWTMRLSYSPRDSHRHRKSNVVRQTRIRTVTYDSSARCVQCDITLCCTMLSTRLFWAAYKLLDLYRDAV